MSGSVEARSNCVVATHPQSSMSFSARVCEAKASRRGKVSPINLLREVGRTNTDRETKEEEDGKRKKTIKIRKTRGAFLSYLHCHIVHVFVDFLFHFFSAFRFFSMNFGGVVALLLFSLSLLHLPCSFDVLPLLSLRALVIIIEEGVVVVTVVAACLTHLLSPVSPFLSLASSCIVRLAFFLFLSLSLPPNPRLFFFLFLS